MTAFDHSAFYGELRKRWGPLKQSQVDDLNAALAKAVAAQEPAWISPLHAKLGEREVPGPKQNLWIQGLWAKLGASWLKSEDDPWCGAAVAYAMQQAGIAYPKNFPAAASWSSWGVECDPQVGAVGVKERKGGHHVFLIVGETADRRYFLCLGGNQSDSVSIVPIARADVTDIRWPAGVPQSHLPLPAMTMTGKPGGSEA